MNRPFSGAFLQSDPKTEPFLKRDFLIPTERARHVARARQRRVGAHVGIEPGAVAVVTGQQIGLFLGPLYTVYKAATVVACAKALEAEAGTRCVPVFWLQTEDHDAAEIDHVWINDGHELKRLHVPLGLNARVSVGNAVLGDDVQAALSQLPDSSLFANHYRPGTRWSDAFAGVLRTLFPSLLIVDPRQHCSATAEIHLRAVDDADRISSLLSQRAQELEQAGFQVQVPVGADVSLSFFHPQGPNGPRYRLAKKDITCSPQQSPESFSSSALLRPIIQDTLLPTAAIVGGPGELNYFAQLAPLYEFYDLPMPMLIPRARFRVIDVSTRRALEALGLYPQDAEDVDLLQRLQKGVSPSPEEIEAELNAAAEKSLSAIPMPDVVARTKGTIARAASRAMLRYRRSIANQDAVLTQRVERIQRSLFPNQTPQERVLGLPSFPNLDILPHLAPWSTTVKDVWL